MHVQSTEFIAPPCAEQINVLYQDDDILVIDKPSGLLSLSGKHPANLDSVHYRLVKDYPSATMIHRLDFGTSGLMVVALNKAANVNLCKQFQNRQTHKRYVAVLDGELTDDCGEITLPLAKAEFPRHKVCLETGKAATSRYRVLSKTEAPKSTRFEFTPITGRTHQLRLHSQAMGHSIWGCDLYDSNASAQRAPRLLLHASYLAFCHPVTGQKIEMHCPAPF